MYHPTCHPTSPLTLLPIVDGWLSGARRVPSPNCNPRPSGTAVDLLVIHNISLPPGQFGTGCVEDFFCNRLDCDSHPYFARLRDLQVSAHLLITRTGEVLQFVSLAERAWHAGVSVWEGRSNCNDYSVGVELEGTDTEPYTDSQYAQLSAVFAALQTVCPGLTPARVVGHEQIAPGRKTDPGPAFDWQRLRQMLLSAEAATTAAAQHNADPATGG